MSERGTGGRMVSVVTSVKVTACEPYDSDSIIKGIIDGAWRHKIARIRENYAMNSTGEEGGKAAKKAERRARKEAREQARLENDSPENHKTRRSGRRRH